MAYGLVILTELDDGSGVSIGIIDGVEVSRRDYDRYLAADHGVRELMLEGLCAFAAQALHNYGLFLAAVSNTVDEIGIADTEVFRPAGHSDGWRERLPDVCVRSPSLPGANSECGSAEQRHQSDGRGRAALL